MGNGVCVCVCVCVCGYRGPVDSWKLDIKCLIQAGNDTVFGVWSGTEMKGST